MTQYRVKVPKLNQRRYVPAQLPDPAGIVSILNSGQTFEGAEALPAEIPNPDMGKWYKDTSGYFYWAGGVDAVVDVDGTTTGSNHTLFESAEAEPINNFWFDNLKISNIWSQYNERGENAKALILDSGVNTDVVPIQLAVLDPLKNFVPGSNTIGNIDPDCHGTHCSSLIAARVNTQFTGTAPGCNLYIGKITENGTLDNADTMKAALKEFLKDEYSFDIISISQELPLPDEDLENLIKNHIDKNRIIIASIGNDYQFKNNTFLRYPGAYKSCISVGSCANDITLSNFSMNPPGTDIFCFGENIFSYKNSTEPKPLSGTSQATAIVAGICCLIVSWLKKNAFAYDSTSVKNLITKYSITLTDNTSLVLIQPDLIFSKLQNFKTYENKNLQDCIDSDRDRLS